MRHQPATSLAAAALFVLPLLAPQGAAADWRAAQVPRPLDETACALSVSSYIDTMLDSASGGDKDFFSVGGGVPNIVFLMDNSAEMFGMPRLPTNTSGPAGCDDAGFNAALVQRGWTRGGPNDFEPFDPEYTHNQAARRLFDKGSYYLFHDHRYNDWVRSGTSGEATRPQNNRTKDNACSQTDDPAACSFCLDQWGYYRYQGQVCGGWWGNDCRPTGETDVSSYVFNGALLNAYPPRFIVARKVMKDVIWDLANVRLGIAQFRKQSADALFSESGAEWLDTARLNPACNTSLGSTGFASNRSRYINAIDNNLAFNAVRPLGEALFNIGQFFTYQDDYYNSWFGSDWLKTGQGRNGFTSQDGNHKSMCWWCQASAVIVVTGGVPASDTQIPSSLRTLHWWYPELWCPDCLTAEGNVSRLHHVTYFLRNWNLRSDHAGSQHVRTYVVGYGVDAPALKVAAELGGGRYFVADDASSLRRAIEDALEDFLDRASVFASPRIAGVQTHATQGIITPSFLPDLNMPWEGSLSRFELLSEFVIDKDLSGTGRPDMMHLVGKGCENVDWNDFNEAEHPACRPIRAATPYDVATAVGGEIELGRMYRMRSFDPAGMGRALASPPQPAVPLWEAGEILQGRDPDERRLFTVVDSNGDGRITADDEVIEFHERNVDKLLSYLDPWASPMCRRLVEGSLDLETGIESVSYRDCAFEIIRFVRGCRFNYAAPGTQEECAPRPAILTDIFHSVPEIIEPPTPYQLMWGPLRGAQSPVTLALPPQYEKMKLKLTEDGKHPYRVFADEHVHRPRIALVGSNGGLLHAFHAGAWDEAAQKWTPGTGQELWAFAPPSLLPKLHLFAAREAHHFFVDGQAWVRNVWVDGLNDNQRFTRFPDEYKTVAVVGLRRGGRHYFALDVTDAHKDDYVPGFLWMFPDIGSEHELTTGQSWNIVAPFPPPIGPIRVKTDRLDAPALEIGEAKIPYEEQWIVALSGGFDNHNLRGQGWHFLDAYRGPTDGEQGDAPLWSFTYDASDPVKSSLKYSIGAVPVLAGWGHTHRDRYQAYFDTMVVGDTGGQLWAARFHHPDPAEWSAARVFEEPGPSAARRPFMQPAWLTVLQESGVLRAFLGTGDRRNMAQGGDGACGPDNIQACVRAGCNLVSGALDVALTDGSSAMSLQMIGGMLASLSLGDSSLNVSSLCEARVKHELAIDSCPQGNQNDVKLYERAVDFECKQGDGGSELFCHVHKDEEPLDLTEQIRCPDTSTLEGNRFYSIAIFDPDGRLPFNSPLEAKAFDDARVTTGTELTDVVDADVTYATAHSAGWYYEYQPGPDDTYDRVAERTASSAVSGGLCVVWSSLVALSSHACADEAGFDENDPCSMLSGQQHSYMYFRNYITGGRHCLEEDVCGPDDEYCPWEAAMGRMSMGQEAEPPPPPQLLTQLSRSGQYSIGIVTTRADSAQLASGDELFQVFGEVAVPPDTHRCRHEGVECE